jgi:hypothetical protein
MQFRAVYIITLVFSLLLAACQSNPGRARPGWIDEPGDGAVGSAGMHVKGRYYQEELAIARARERLAARYGVDVASIQTIKQRVVNERAYVSSDKETIQQISKTTVKAHVRETWHDKVRDEIWVWVYPVD